MKYHNITTDDMRNGEGLRTVLWLAGCSHHCKGCHNPTTWDPDDGLEVDESVELEIIEKLKPDYISGLTLSGGDPLYSYNLPDLMPFIRKIRSSDVGNKTIWMYTGYTWEELTEKEWGYELRDVLEHIDILIDGRYIESLADSKYHWAGSTNQRVIDVQKSLEKGEVVLYETN